MRRGIVSLIIIIVIMLVSFLNSSTVKAGNDIISGFLRTDLSVITSAMDYKVELYADNQLPYLRSSDTTSSWLSVGNDPIAFIQVGLLAFGDGRGLNWFVEALPANGPKVRCLLGTGYWETYENGLRGGCYGNTIPPFGSISANNWYQVQLANYGFIENGHHYWSAVLLTGSAND